MWLIELEVVPSMVTEIMLVPEPAGMVPCTHTWYPTILSTSVVRYWIFRHTSEVKCCACTCLTCRMNPSFPLPRRSCYISPRALVLDQGSIGIVNIDIQRHNQRVSRLALTWVLGRTTLLGARPQMSTWFCYDDDQ